MLIGPVMCTGTFFMERKMDPAHSRHFIRFGISLHLIHGLLVCLLLSTAPAAFSNDDSNTLLMFRDNSIQNSNDIPQQFFSWNEGDQTPCAWQGVTCKANDSVAGLNFSSWGLDPTVPYLYLLSALTDLRQLDLSANSALFRDGARLSGNINGTQIMTMPKGIGSLTVLTYLDLSRNDYEGEIPASISGCQNLQTLFLKDNLLEGGISALAGMTRLQVLDLSNNRLNGSFANFGEMPMLLALDPSNNRLIGSLSNASNFPGLWDLYLDNNYFTKLEDSFFDRFPSNISKLSLSGNQLQGSIPPSIANLSYLQFINLSDNQLSGPLPSLSAHGLFSLDLSQNFFSGYIPANLIVPSLSGFGQCCPASVNLSYNSLTGNISAILLDAVTRSGAISLDLSHNQLSGPVPHFPPMWKNEAIDIFKMFLNDNQLSGSIFSLTQAKNMTNVLVREMHLQNNQFNGDMSRIAVNLRAMIGCNDK